MSKTLKVLALRELRLERKQTIHILFIKAKFNPPNLEIRGYPMTYEYDGWI
jgi:hypothetical protein